MNGWMDGWVDGKTVSRIVHSNQKFNFYCLSGQVIILFSRGGFVRVNSFDLQPENDQDFVLASLFLWALLFLSIYIYKLN